jgi:ABC-type uncharacterized transport system auxiliary subunit
MKMQVAAVVMTTLALAGCGSVRYPTSYLLNLPAPAPQAAPAQEPLGPVAVREFRCPDYLCEGRLIYRPTPEEVGFYEYHRWAASPRQAITESMADALRARSLFKSVTVHERGIEAAYVLTGTIERLEEVDQDGDVQAVCTISALLVEARSGSLVWQHTASEAVPVRQRNVAGVVVSLSSAARAVIDRLAASVAKDLASGRP